MVTESIFLTDGREIKIKASGATPRLYRNLFFRDIFDDMDQFTKGYAKAVFSGINAVAKDEEEEKDSEKKLEDIIKTPEIDSESDLSMEDMTTAENMLYALSEGVIYEIQDETVVKKKYESVEKMLETMSAADLFLCMPYINLLWLKNLNTLEKSVADEEEENLKKKQD